MPAKAPAPSHQNRIAVTPKEEEPEGPNSADDAQGVPYTT